MTKNEVVKQVEEKARVFFKTANGCHDWSHIERVRRNALRIAQEEGADLFLVELSVLLHDIGRNKEMRNKGRICHAEIGAVMAKQILLEYGLSRGQIGIVTNAIRAHRFRNEHKPESIEAKVLQDADKLDAIGALGIGRAFLFAGNAGSGTMYTGNEKRIAKQGGNYSYTGEDSAVLEYEVKLKHLRKAMNTKTGKMIARERSIFMDKFFKQFWDEIEGKK